MTLKRNLFRDILRDTNSRKFSMTKVSAFVVLILLIISVGIGITIMFIEKEVDHILIGELIALLLTLLGFKNFRGNFRALPNENNQSKESFLAENIVEKEKTIPVKDKDELTDEEMDELG